MPKQSTKRQVGRPFKKGEGGRPPGIPNKFTTLKNAFLEAFDRTGGVDGLVAWIQESRQNQGAFYTLITRLFPQEVEHSGSGPDNALIVKVIHTTDAEGGNGNGGNGGAK